MDHVTYAAPSLGETNRDMQPHGGIPPGTPSHHHTITPGTPSHQAHHHTPGTPSHQAHHHTTPSHQAHHHTRHTITPGTPSHQAHTHTHTHTDPISAGQAAMSAGMTLLFITNPKYLRHPATLSNIAFPQANKNGTNKVGNDRMGLGDGACACICACHTVSVRRTATPLTHTKRPQAHLTAG